MRKCFKEWNAIVESLGMGKQSILIRKYKTNVDKFLLYPTVSYTLKDNYLDAFQKEYRDFAKNNALPKVDKNDVELKYFASVEGVYNLSIRKAVSINDYHIWNKDHIKNYLNDKTGFLWLLRVYELDEPVMGNTKRAAITFAELNKDISLEDSKPVLSNKEFENLKLKLNL